MDKEDISKSTNRSIRAKKNIIAMFIIRGISISISLLYVPLLLNTLKSYEYAIWLTLTSLMAWISMFDIGLGNGLRNKLSMSMAEHDIDKAKKYVSTAYICIGCIVSFLSIVFICVYKYIPWVTILNASEIDSSQLIHLILIVVLSFFTQFALSLINSVLLALQMPAISSFIAMVGQLMSFIGVIIVVKLFHSSSLLTIGAIITIIPPVILLLSSLFLFNGKRKDICPNFKYFEWNKIHDIFSLGIKFFCLQIITIILFYSNNLIITHVIGDTAVVQYNIAYKYMNMLNLAFTIVITPIWSATTEAYTLKDFDWIKRINRKLIKIASVLGILGIVMLIASPIVYHLWLGNAVTIDISTTGLLYLYSIFLILYGCYGYILNGMGKLTIQLVMTGILAIAYVPLAIAAGKVCGLNGILVVFAMTALLNLCWSKMQYSKIINNKAFGIWDQ